jgi:hypothetical protein
MLKVIEPGLQCDVEQRNENLYAKSNQFEFKLSAVLNVSMTAVSCCVRPILRWCGMTYALSFTLRLGESVEPIWL